MSIPRILLADDDVNFLQALTVRLRAEGFDVIVAQDAVQTLQFARQQEPDLLLLDINMPAGDGFSVHQRLREQPDLPEIPVVFVTGDRSERVQRMAAAARATLLYKPFDTAELLRAIGRGLGNTPARDDALASLQAAADALTHRPRTD
ncbi:MAG: response regulator [Phycisphaerales bacterium]|nr:response regulator [Phycisphaerae bacterium]NNF44329.1 response regulator [Phycisphaerales bacterium]NNM26381.1 response regulator [Phycisphaerales bacterium]